MRKPVLFFVAIIVAGLCNGCGGGQTKPGDPNKVQHRCGPDTRCGGPIEDDNPPQKTSQNSAVSD